MEAKDLIGQWAVRTAPVKLDSGALDYSYTTSQVLIVNVTESHIVYKHRICKGLHLLDARWLDDKWISYNSLSPLLTLEGGDGT